MISIVVYKQGHFAILLIISSRKTHYGNIAYKQHVNLLKVQCHHDNGNVVYKQHVMCNNNRTNNQNILVYDKWKHMYTYLMLGFDCEIFIKMILYFQH